MSLSGVSSEHTIYALASGTGAAGIAVIRISGPETASVLSCLIRAAMPKPRYATRAFFHTPTGERLDDGLVLWFPAPASFTGENVAELHVHGGRAVIAGISAALSAAGARIAEPGEFTRRAFLNNKMDLTQAEAIADLIEAETAVQRRQALRQMEGELGKLYEAWRQKIIRLLAYSEALIDFSDEDLPADVEAKRVKDLEEMCAALDQHLNDAHRGQRIRDGFEIAIIGAPNAGKSSLLNALAGRDAAIVSTRAGTTRDVIEVHLELAGYPVILADTAGLREAEDEIEREGIRRARDRAQRADLVLALFDSSAPLPDIHTLEALDKACFVVLTKQDLAPLPAATREWASIAEGPWPRAHLSIRTGDGMDEFLVMLSQIIENRLTGGALSLTRQRHRDALCECLAALQRACTADLPELAGEDLRLAARAVGRITGRVDVDDLLDVIFRDFCIGK